jgi:hypothetical protein
MIQTERKKKVYFRSHHFKMREREREGGREREKRSSEMGRSQYHATDEEVQSASPSCCFTPRETAPDSNAAGGKIWILRPRCKW